VQVAETALLESDKSLAVWFQQHISSRVF